MVYAALVSIMDILETRYGALAGISNSMTYKDGSLKSCMLNAENRIQTPVGEIIPQYRVAELGERQKKHRSSLSFFESGQIKSASLDRMMPLQTPIGVFKTEFVTFYEDGSVNRLFPLNGHIDGYWSEKTRGIWPRFLTSIYRWGSSAPRSSICISTRAVP